MRILLVEDEEKVARFIQRGLEADGYRVTIAADGKKGERDARSGNYDLVILDILLPRKNGFEVVQSLRKAGHTVPVLMLTALSSNEDIVRGLDLGADDYIVKPFAFKELVARIRSLLRRDRQSKRILQVSDLRLDTVAHKAFRNGKTILLTRREYALLEFFMRNPFKLLTRRQLQKDVWGYDFDPGTNIVDVYINHLRRKIDQAFPEKLLHSVRGRGYILTDRIEDLQKL